MSDDPAVCLIGWPAAHSRSPVIHKHWLKTLGIPGDYRIEAVKPEAFATFIADLSALAGIAGGTILNSSGTQATLVSTAGS